MPKWRKLYTQTCDSPDVNEMPDDFTRLMWVMLPLGLDRCGRGYDNPAWVRSQIFKMRVDVTIEMIDDALDWYEAHGMIERYEKRGRKYFWIPTWHKYQGDTSREADSVLPAPDSYADPYNDEPEERTNSGATHEQVESKSPSDVDVDTDAEADVDVETDAPDDDCNPFALYEDATASTLTRILADHIVDLVDECEEHRQKLPDGAGGADVSGEQWVCAAIREATESTNRFGIRYVGAILDRWREEGYGPAHKSNGKGPPEKRRIQYRDPSTGDLVEKEVRA